MNPFPRPLVLLARSMIAAGLLAGCSSSDTVVALTVNTDAELQAIVTKVRVTVTPASGSATSVDIMPARSDGSIAASFFERIKVSGSGDAAVHAVGLDGSGAMVGSGDTTVKLVSEGAVAGRVTLSVGGGAGDGGADAAEDGGADGAATDGAAADGGGDAASGS